jgi:hypothetical protein
MLQPAPNIDVNRPRHPLARIAFTVFVALPCRTAGITKGGRTLSIEVALGLADEYVKHLERAGSKRSAQDARRIFTNQLLRASRVQLDDVAIRDAVLVPDVLSVESGLTPDARVSQ